MDTGGGQRPLMVGGNPPLPLDGAMLTLKMTRTAMASATVSLFIYLCLL